MSFWTPDLGPFRLEEVPCDLCGADRPTPLAVVNGFHLVRCAACDLVYVSPRPTAEDLRRLYERSPGEAEPGNAADGPCHARRLQMISTGAPRRLLDVGCSAGLFLAAAARKGWEAHGLELSSRKAGAAHGRGNVHGTWEDLQALPDGHFGAVLFQDVLEHLPSPRAALAVTRRLLAPGGVLFVSLPLIDGLMARVSYHAFYWTVGLWRHPAPPWHLYDFSEATLGRLLSGCGFRMRSRRRDQTTLRYLAGLLPGEEPVLKRRLASARMLYLAAILPVALAGWAAGRGDHGEFVCTPA